ncbi:MAG: VOC family protein [Proteobacteria bacterium]|nr:VOC family protein [Pseudomonadota bacterium]
MLDHIAHFVEDLEAARAALEALGFVVAPRSDQSLRDAAGHATPAGSSNHCVMLEAGYLEILAPTTDTPNARRLREAMARYRGVHILALGTPDAQFEFAQLARHRFEPLPTVHLERDIETADGAVLRAQFSVQRVPPERMPEGRVQFCEQKTPEALWQPRWLGHANGVTALAAVFVCVEDRIAAGARYAEFAAAMPAPAGDFVRLDTARGLVFIGERAACASLLGESPAAPALAGYALACRDPEALATRLERLGCSPTRVGDLWRATLPPALGSSWLFGPAEALENGLPRTA